MSELSSISKSRSSPVVSSVDTLLVSGSSSLSRIFSKPERSSSSVFSNPRVDSKAISPSFSSVSKSTPSSIPDSSSWDDSLSLVASSSTLRIFSISDKSSANVPSGLPSSLRILSISEISRASVFSDSRVDSRVALPSSSSVEKSKSSSPDPCVEASPASGSLSMPSMPSISSRSMFLSSIPSSLDVSGEDSVPGATGCSSPMAKSAFSCWPAEEGG